MVTRWKATSTIHLFLPVLVLCGLITSCAPTLVGPTDPNSSLVVGRIVINNKHSGDFFGILPLGTLDQGIEVEVLSWDKSQYFKVTSEQQGYFFIPNIPLNGPEGIPQTYYVRRARIEGTVGSQTEGYRMRLNNLYFIPVPGKIVYIGTIFVDLSERGFTKRSEVREDEKARAYFLQKHGGSAWGSREFTPPPEKVDCLGAGCVSR